MKKYVCKLLLAVMCMLVVPQMAAEAAASRKVETAFTGWKTQGGKRSYYADGVKQVKWKTIEGKRYYFDKKGTMVTGWYKIKKKWYKFGKKGVYLGVCKKKTIVLDPGHSGKVAGGYEPLGPGSGTMKAKDNSGTQGIATGVPEYQLTLTLSKAVKVELERKGYRVILTRSNHKKAVSCKQRAEVANKANADAYIRIHANGSSNTSVYGAMTICTSSRNPYISKSLTKKNKKLSSVLLDYYIKATKTRKEYVWETDTMSGNNWSKVPTTLIEVGYMSNPAEDRKMQTSSYQKKMVKGIVNGIVGYFGKG